MEGSLDYRDPLNLYGGRSDIFFRMNELVVRELRGYHDVSGLAEYLSSFSILDKDVISKIINGDTVVGLNEWMALKSSLGLCLGDTFGSPIGLDNPSAMEYWESEQTRRPMSALPDGSQMDIKMYVGFRAVGEIYRKDN